MFRHPSILPIVDDHVSSLVSAICVHHYYLIELLSVVDAIFLHISSPSVAEIEGRIDLSLVES